MNKVNFNIKGVIYGAIVMILIIGGFIVIPNMFMEQSKPVDYTILQREAIPEKILDMMDKYVNEERSLAVKLENKIYVVVTRGNDKNHGIEMDKIDILKQDDKNIMSIFKANSYTKFNLPIIVTDPDEIKNIDALTVGFKAIKRTLFRNTDKQSYYVTYNVKNLLQDSRFKKGYNNEIKIFITISEILNSEKLEDAFLYDELSKLDIILGELKNSEISDQALSDIVNMYK